MLSCSNSFLGLGVLQLRLFIFVLVCSCTTIARAQTPEAVPSPTSDTLAGFASSQWHLERLSEHHWRLTGQVEMERDQLSLFADQVDLFTDTNQLVAEGNVVFTNPEGRISATRVELDTNSNAGNFYDASGILSLGSEADLAEFGGQDPDVYFYADHLEKLDDRRYRLTRGAFTTCVQPTPRWELTSGSILINLDEYAVLKNTILRVKGVPLMYMPFAYYPLQQDGRATGFLLPKYGTSTLRGQALSNAFFLALGRSQDATLFHDWFTRTGQGVGAEYRYLAGGGSQGSFRSYLFNQHSAEFTASDGSVSELPESRSFELTGSLTQALGGGFRGRARFDYFSDITTQQLYHSNLYEASRRLRTLGGSLSGNWGPYSLSTVYQRNETFEGDNGSIVYGSTPRISGSIAQRPLFGLPIYGGVTGEYSYLLYQDRRGGGLPNSSMNRMDFFPSIRVPFSKLSYLTVNSSAAYRLTHYSQSLDARQQQRALPLTRSYLTLRSDVIGPVVTRVWDTPTSGFAERLKHVIEPTFAFDWTSQINNFKQIAVLTDASDFVVGGMVRLTYGLTNRLLARTHGTEDTPGQAREILAATIQQTYYTNSEAKIYDVNYASSMRAQQSNFSTVALTVRASPTRSTDTTIRVEHDPTGGGLNVFSLTSSAYWGNQSVSGSWSHYNQGEGVPASSYVTANTGIRLHQGRLGGNYALSWDAGRGDIVSQSITVFYNAQCCGIGFEYQSFNYPQLSTRFPIPADRRINFSFMLAGLGTFSNFFGAFGGPQ